MLIINILYGYTVVYYGRVYGKRRIDLKRVTIWLFDYWERIIIKDYCMNVQYEFKGGIDLKSDDYLTIWLSLTNLANTKT